MTTDEFFNNVISWAHERNLIFGSTPEKQFIKLVEEVGELAHGLARQDSKEIDDAIGDCMVILTIIARQRNAHMYEICNDVWEIIKDRKGKMVDGIFVKEGE